METEEWKSPNKDLVCANIQQDLRRRKRAIP